MLLSCFIAVVVLFAQRLPIGRVPEQGAITFVRLDVVHNLRQRSQPIALAHHTKWVAHQKFGASALPG